MESDRPTSRIRLFVAIPIPEPVRKNLAGIQLTLRPFVQPGAVRWTRPDQFHLTLQFLGDVPVQAAERLNESLAEVCAGARPFPLCAKGIGFFPDIRSPRVIWVGIEDRETVLAPLQAAVERALAPFAEKPIPDKFLAHATLGRFQKYRRHLTEKLVPQARRLGKECFGDWRAENIGLFRSELSPSGAQYDLLAAFPLGPVARA